MYLLNVNRGLKAGSRPAGDGIDFLTPTITDIVLDLRRRTLRLLTDFSRYNIMPSVRSFTSLFLLKCVPNYSGAAIGSGASQRASASRRFSKPSPVP